jgi:hypothetical protein
MTPYFDGERDRLVSLAARYAVPAVFQWREFVKIGGLMSYGTSILDAYLQAGTYVSKNTERRQACRLAGIAANSHRDGD